ncbi:hypothetical protein H8356DRAFT_1365864 [Neocallimastix lanati (nom. inval.)]|nr:hypothetical protein H8356DRAFT_1365864 [Neocallimastix sp. JGI-2020a]
MNNGITKIYSSPYNPQNNGKYDRFNQTLINCAKTMLIWSKFDQKFWDYAFNYVFDHDKGKFEAYSNKKVLLGFNFRAYNYIFMDYKNLMIHIVREATFEEDQPANFILNNNKITDNLYSSTIKLFSNDSDNTIEIESNLLMMNQVTTICKEFYQKQITNNKF